MSLNHTVKGTHHTLEFDQMCNSCKGTGLYVGFAEKDGAAVVCHGCKGSGCYKTKIEFDEFHGRIHRSGIKRVYASNPGIVIGHKKDVCKLSDFGGVPYDEWVLRDDSSKSGFAVGSEDRAHTCPAWWYQGVNYDMKPRWDDSERRCIGCGSFSDCDHFHEKAGCWEKFDRELKK